MFMRRIYNMTIISNNCSGAYEMRVLGINPYTSPTVFLQILPTEYPKFCKDFKRYMSYELVEYTDFSEEHKYAMQKLLGFIPTFPCGLLGDIAILFQHEKSFNVAKEKWDRRKLRIDYDNIYYMFCIEFPVFRNCAVEFANLHLPNSVLFMRSFDIETDIPHYRYDKDVEYLLMQNNGKFVFEGEFERNKFFILENKK